MLQHFAGFHQLRPRGAFLNAQHFRYFFMIVALNGIQIEHDSIPVGQSGDDVHQALGFQIAIHIGFFGGFQLPLGAVHFRPETAALVVPERRVDGDAPHPAFQRAFELKICNAIKYFDERVLQQVLRFFMAARIPKTDRHHFAGIPAEQLLLTGAIFPDTTSCEFFFSHFLRGLARVMLTEIPPELFSLL